MNIFISYSNMIIGAAMIAFALIMTTSGLRSAVIFKVLPFFGGVILLFNGCKLIGLI